MCVHHLVKLLYSKSASTRSFVKRTAMQDSAIQNICWKIFHLPNDDSIISVHWRKHIYSGHTKKPTEWLTECICSNQEERRHDKTPAHKINVQSLMASVGESQVVDSTPVWYLSITKSRLTRPIIVKWCCYNSYCLLSVRSQASSSSFSRQCSCAHSAETVSFLSRNFARCWPISKILSKQTKHSKFVIKLQPGALSLRLQYLAKYHKSHHTLQVVSVFLTR